MQLTQLVSRHPLAIRDERGQMALSILGKAHGAWQAEESDARAFNRAMALQTRRTQDAKSIFETEQDYKRTHPAYYPGVGVATLEDPNDPTGQPNVLLPVAPKGNTGAVYGSSPQGVYNRSTGLDPQGKPLPAPGQKPITAYQQAQLRRNDRKDKLLAINKEIDQYESNIKSGEAAYEAAYKREREATIPEEKLKNQLEKTKIGSDTDALKAEKAKRLYLLQKLRDEDTQDAAVPADAAAPEGDVGLPPVPADAAAAPVAPANDLVVVINPAGKHVQIKRSQLGAALQGGYKQQ